MICTLFNLFKRSN